MSSINWIADIDSVAVVGGKIVSLKADPDVEVTSIPKTEAASPSISGFADIDAVELVNGRLVSKKNMPAAVVYEPETTIIAETTVDTARKRVRTTWKIIDQAVKTSDRGNNNTDYAVVDATKGPTIRTDHTVADAPNGGNIEIDHEAVKNTNGDDIRTDQDTAKATNRGKIISVDAALEATNGGNTRTNYSAHEATIDENIKTNNAASIATHINNTNFPQENGQSSSVENADLSLEPGKALHPYSIKMNRRPVQAADVDNDKISKLDAANAVKATCKTLNPEAPDFARQIEYQVLDNLTIKQLPESIRHAVQPWRPENEEPVKGPFEPKSANLYAFSAPPQHFAENGTLCWNRKTNCRATDSQIDHNPNFMERDSEEFYPISNPAILYKYDAYNGKFMPCHPEAYVELRKPAPYYPTTRDMSESRFVYIGDFWPGPVPSDYQAASCLEDCVTGRERTCEPYEFEGLRPNESPKVKTPPRSAYASSGSVSPVDLGSPRFGGVDVDEQHADLFFEET